MKTVLIVEDEKMIRQGIKTMIQRSGVPVEIIMECNNGEMALEVLKEQKIDVMFTDIRMPKMDGIELVKRMQECEHIPLTVAISGYDDFAYAVEMLRNGVREYMLKPIEREKIVEVLTKLNEEIESKKERVETYQKIGYQQIRHMIVSDTVSEEELQTIEKEFGKHFYQGSYVMCCQNSRKREKVAEHCFFLEGINGSDIFVVEEVNLEQILKNELQGGYVGISKAHQGIRELRSAYSESFEMRKVAFARNKISVSYDEKKERIPEALLLEAAKLTEETAKLRRVQLLGTDHTDELEKCWKQFFFEVKNGRISEKMFESCMQEFFEEAEKTYRNVLVNLSSELNECKNIWCENCIDTYEEKMMDFIMQLHESINHQFDVNRNTQKMKAAVEYIDKNYASDLNMAVVSNYISMNYSLFSYSFKQYTGSNFVNYLKERRMSEAKKLLAETDRKIVEISQEVGYDNEKHFMKIFKTTCGVSPTEYRKNMKHGM